MNVAPVYTANTLKYTPKMKTNNEKYHANKFSHLFCVTKVNILLVDECVVCTRFKMTFESEYLL